MRLAFALLRLAVVLAIGVSALGTRASAADRPAQPNVVVILGDDMGYGDIGVHGSRDIPTPSIDAIAANGVRFTNGYVSAPQCSQSRAGLLTGRYQERFGHEFNLGPKSPNGGLPLTETTLADRMKAAGYATGIIGKWHLGLPPEFHPQRRGFDEFFGFLSGAHTYFGDRTRSLYRGTTLVDEGETYLTDAIGREAKAFIDAHKAKPFFLYVAFNAVHTPMQAPPERVKRFERLPANRRVYAAMMTAMDDAIGGIVTKLADDGLLANTLLVFVNDNGGPLAAIEASNASSNAPLRGSKRTMLEGGIRVPFMLQWPGKVGKGVVYDLPVIQLDVMPTALAAAGVEVKPEWKLDGVNLLPHLAGGGRNRMAPPHEALYWRMGPQMAIRRGPWKLVRYDLAVDVTGDNVSGEDPGISEARLYDLQHDIGEKTDVAAAHPKIVRELQAAWDRWNAGNVAPLWPPSYE